MSERRFTDDETAAILRRSAIQDDAQANTNSIVGYTLAEIQAIGLEAGIDPQHIAESAAFVESRERSDTSWFIGAPTACHFEYVVPRELADSQLLGLVDEVRLALDMPGQVSQVPGGLEWVEDTDRPEPVWVSLRIQDGTTRIQLRSKKRLVAAAILSGTTGAGGFLAVIGSSLLGPLDLTSVLLVGSGFFLGFSGGRIVWRAKAARWRDQMTSLITQLARKAEEPIDRPLPLK